MGVNQNKLNILYIITKLELGGAQKVCLELCKSLQAAGHKTCLISGAEGQLVAQLSNYIPKQSQIILLPSFKREVSLKNLWLELKNFNNLVLQIRQLKKTYPDLIVHAHSTKAGLLGRWAALFAGVKKRVYTIHGYGFNQYQPKLVALIIYLLELITSLITTDYVCVSELDLKTGVKLFPGFKRKAQLIRAGVDDQLFMDYGSIHPVFTSRFRQGTHHERRRITTSTYKRTKENIYSEQDVPSAYCIDLSCKFSRCVRGECSSKLEERSRTYRTITFGTVACFKPQKNLFDLLRAFHHLKILDPAGNYKLEIIGDGELRLAIETWIRAHNLQNYIILHGWQAPENLPKIMAQWHCFTLSSLWEGLPCAIVEARCLKLPVLAYNTGGISELIFNSKNGFLYPQGDWLGLAHGMYNLSHDHVLYQKLSDYPDDLSSYSYSYMAQAHIEIYLR